MSRALSKRETRLSAKLAKVEKLRKTLRRELQLTRMKIAGLRRRAQTKSHKAVAALLAKTDPRLYQQLAAKMLGGKRGRGKAKR